MNFFKRLKEFFYFTFIQKSNQGSEKRQNINLEIQINNVQESYLIQEESNSQQQQQNTFFKSKLEKDPSLILKQQAQESFKKQNNLQKKYDTDNQKHCDSLSQFIWRNYLEKIQKIVTQKISQKIQNQFKCQYQQLSKSFSANKIKYADLQKNYQLILNENQKLQKLNLQLKKSISLCVCMKNFQNISQVQKVISTQNISQQLFQRFQSNQSFQQSKKIQIKEQISLSSSYPIKEQILSQFSIQVVQKKIKLLFKQIRFYKKRFQIIKSNMSQNQIYKQKQKNIITYSNLYQLENHFPFALKYKLFLAYYRLYEVLLNQQENNEEYCVFKQKYSQYYLQEKIERTIDATLKQFKIIEFLCNQKTKNSLQFTVKKLEMVNQNIQNFVFQFFNQKMNQLKNNLNEINFYFTQNKSQIILKSLKDEIIVKMIFLFQRHRYYDLFYDQLRNCTKISKKIIQKEIKQILWSFIIFVKQFKNKKKLHQLSQYIKKLIWILYFIQNLQKHQEIQQQFSPFFSAIQFCLSENLENSFKQKLEQNQKDINEIKLQYVQSTINLKNLNLLSLKIQFNIIKDKIIQGVDKHAIIESIIIISNFYLQKKQSRSSILEILQNKDILKEVKLYLKDQFWKMNMKNLLLDSILNFCIPQSLIIDFILIEETLRKCKQYSKNKKWRHQLNAFYAEPIKNFYTEKLQQCRQVKTNFMQKNIHILTNHLLESNLNWQIQNQSFNIKNELHLTNSIQFQQVALKILQSLKYFQKQSQLLEKQKKIIKKINENLQMEFQDTREYSQSSNFQKVVQDKKKIAQFGQKVIFYEKQFWILFQYFSINKEKKIQNRQLEKLKKIDLVYLVNEKINMLLQKYSYTKKKYQNHIQVYFNLTQGVIYYTFYDLFKDFAQIQNSCFFHKNYVQKMYKLNPLKYQNILGVIVQLQNKLYQSNVFYTKIWRYNVQKIIQKGQLYILQNDWKILYQLYNEQFLKKFSFLKKDLEFLIIFLSTKFIEYIQSFNLTQKKEINLFSKNNLHKKVKKLKQFCQEKNISCQIVKKCISKLIQAEY